MGRSEGESQAVHGGTWSKRCAGIVLRAKSKTCSPEADAGAARALHFEALRCSRLAAPEQPAPERYRARPAMPLDTIVIAGGSLAGIRCAEALRRRGYSGRLVFVSAESERPYDRPPLSK